MFDKLNNYIFYYIYYFKNRKKLKKIKETMEADLLKQEEIKRINEEIRKNSILVNCSYLPERKTSGSACFDLKAELKSPFIVIRSGECVEINTGLKVEIPTGKVGLVFMRSGISSNTWLGLSNSVGVIDSDYRGDIKLFIRNYSPSKRFTINNGDRIAQLLIVDCFTPTLLNSKNLSVTERNTSGFGSTGVK